MGFVGNNEVNKRFESETAERRRQSDEADRRLKENAERERRGLPSLEVEERNAAVRERQRQYFERQNAPATGDEDIKVQLAVREASLKFLATSDYHRTPRNFQMLTEYIDQHNLDATDERSFHIAYQALRDQMERPGRTQQTQAAEPPVAETVPPGSERAPDGRVYTAAELAAMSSDEYAKAFRLQRGHQYKVKTSEMGFQYVDDENDTVGLPL